MKNTLYHIAAALLVLIATGCQKEENIFDYQTHIVGEWHFASEKYDTDVYVAFTADESFDLYQKVGEGRYRHYRGSWAIDKNILSGTYSDGTPWGSSYKMTFNGTDAMTLTAQNGSEDTADYVRESVPASVKDDVVVKSSPLMLNSQPQYRWL